MMYSINIEYIRDIALKASYIILDIYNNKFDINYRDDKSSLTQADIKANDIICSSLKELYPSLVPTMEWDTAAADAIVREAGKMTYQFDSEKPVLYNKENLLNPWFVVK